MGENIDFWRVTPCRNCEVLNDSKGNVFKITALNSILEDTGARVKIPVRLIPVVNPAPKPN